MSSFVPTPVRDVALLIGRVLLGGVFIAHGWQKLVTNGVPATADGFAQMGIPAPTAAAWFATLVELAGGALLVVGLATPVVGLLLAADMAGAYVFAHAGNGVFVDRGGAELVAALGALSLVLAVVGSGRASVDRLVAGRVRSSRAGATARA